MHKLAGIPLILLVAATASAKDLEWIEVSPQGDGFIRTESQRPFVPWGFNYDHEGDGALLEDYWDEKWPVVEEAFAEMKGLGANVVRVHLQFGRFMKSPTQPNAEALQKLQQLLRLAEETGLYLDVTGLGCYHKQDVPTWYDALDENARWQAQAVFWEAVAKTCADSPAVFCYDLMNEPVVPGGDSKRDDWLGPGFAGKHFVQFITLDRAGRDRTEVARAWIKTLVAAIRKHDQRHLITVGLVPWSLDRPGLTSGFVPEKIADQLDFIAFHLYPEKGKLDEALDTLKGFAATGKPVVIEEMFTLKCGADELGEFIDASQGKANGWIGFYWGQTPDELREVNTIPAAITLSWLELFQEKGPQIIETTAAFEFLNNGVTAHRGNSAEFPENTLPAFESGIAVGADWIELDVFRTQDGKLVVIHDATTKRVGDKDLTVSQSTYNELQSVDVATEFRKRQGLSVAECPPQNIPLLEEVLRLVMKQRRTRVSIQPKVDCVAEAVELIRELKAEKWVGFNEGNVDLMIKVKQLAPEIPVIWDRPADCDLDVDLPIAREHKFESMVVHHTGLTAERVQRIRNAGFEVGAWTVNEADEMQRLLDLGVQRIYTDYPKRLLALQAERRYHNVACEGTYPHHLQGVCVDDSHIYWSFTTKLVKTDLEGHVLLKIPVANHHGDLCFHDGKLYVAVNLGKFNDPNGNADSWVYVYDAQSLKELSRHQTAEVFHGAGGIGFTNEHFFVVGGLPEGFQENFVYEYDRQFQFVKKHIVPSGHTLLGIQTATFANDRWWFGCYGDPKILLVTDDKFQMQGRYEFDCSLGIVPLPGGRFYVASGRCEQGKECTGRLQLAVPSEEFGLLDITE
ncbi:MAG: cellulase family glycosylhydrolase [Planctomycetaceae bacterium]|nr:cellulase family glycosylhydrolase [Planctomycetaceae bacterium]MCB9951799.1 cellulase family glycosylhydrolase [Planctomycetaceae bacterium]